MQVDVRLLELTAYPKDFDAQCQTEAFLERPLTPRFVPSCVGCDVSTEIPEGDLFDFDTEIAPLLEVLIGKTIELGLMEVLEEEELKALRTRQERFEQLRTAELVEIQRLEAAERRRAEEKERRMREESARKERETATIKKIVSGRLAKHYFSGIVEDVLHDLKDAGKFADPIEVEIEIDFMPLLVAEVLAEASRTSLARNYVAEKLIMPSTSRRCEANYY